MRIPTLQHSWGTTHEHLSRSSKIPTFCSLVDTKLSWYYLEKRRGVSQCLVKYLYFNKHQEQTIFSFCFVLCDILPGFNIPCTMWLLYWTTKPTGTISKSKSTKHLNITEGGKGMPQMLVLFSIGCDLIRLNWERCLYNEALCQTSFPHG